MKNSPADYNYNNVHNYPGYSTNGPKDGKICFLSVTNNSKKCENVKQSAPPLKLKPAFMYEDCAETGLDNPAYFDAIKLRKAERTSTKKKKFSSLGIEPDQSDSAKLTKVPGLNIWRLDFSKVDSGSVRKGQTSAWCRFALSIAIIIVLLLLITGIAIIVHAVKGGLIFGIPWFSFESEDIDSGVNKVAAHFRIMNRYFTSELGNASSEAYSQLVAELKLSFDIVLLDSLLMNYYNTTDEFVFKNGSVVVECMIHLVRPVLDGAQSVGFAFLTALEKGKGILPPGRLYVDVHTVRFAAVVKQVDENVLQDLQGLDADAQQGSSTKRKRK